MSIDISIHHKADGHKRITIGGDLTDLALFAPEAIQADDSGDYDLNNNATFRAAVATLAARAIHIVNGHHRTGGTNAHNH